MASAVSANRNESDWTQPRGGAKFMGKIDFAKPNPKFSKKKQFHAVPAVDIDESPPVTQSFTSDNASSINRRPVDANSGGYVTFNVASYSKKELTELKSRLFSELDQIRQLKTRIEGNDFHIRSCSNVLPPKKSANKNISGNKRPLPSSFGNDFKKSTSNPKIAPLMKGCGQILSKLMKTKHIYLFNKPVDVAGLGLHDYHGIIKHPMDLGTVKLKLGQKSYESPLDFAADVRLTFNNAMTYNPKGHDVYIIADQLLGRFEELFRSLNVKLGDNKRQERDYHEEFRSSSYNRSEPEKVREDRDDNIAQKASPELQIRNPQCLSNPNPNENAQSTTQMPARIPSPMQAPPVKLVKQAKPKAKDPNKREMSMEEKHKLGLGLQSLPPEKMEQVVQIIRKRNGHLTQDGDEIELDIETMDTETFWELDRFVTYYKKMVSKIKRQSLMGINVPAFEVHGEEVPANEGIEVSAEAKKPKKGDAAGDEDVDIGDEMPMSSFPPVEIEKDNGHASSDSSSSSSSSGDSSSSSDSDSGSSSGSDSDNAQS